MTESMLYCALCSNEPVTSSGEIGPLCKPWIEGPMQAAFDAYRIVAEAWGQCCAGLSPELAFARSHEERIRMFTRGSYIYLHPKMYGESNYAPDYATKSLMYVECGIRFGAEGATCYWIFDNDTIGMSEGHELSGYDEAPISYAQDRETFLRSVASVLETAAESAYMADYLICDGCGGHYYGPNGPCCGGEDGDEDAEFAAEAI